MSSNIVTLPAPSFSFDTETNNSRIFDNGRLSMARFDGRYFDLTVKAHYYITDLLGNSCVVTDANGKLVQTTFYYPYGEPWEYPEGQQFRYLETVNALQPNK